MNASARTRATTNYGQTCLTGNGIADTCAIIGLTMPILGPVDPAKLLSGASHVLQRVRRSLQADHAAIGQRVVRFMPDTMMRYYLYAAVAPSRWSARAGDQRNVSRAQAFAEDVAPGGFPAVPLQAENGLVLLGTRAPDGALERARYVRSSGLVELLWTLSPQPDGEQLLLHATELVAVTSSMAAAVARTPYAELSLIGRGRRRFGKVDWLFGVATAVSSSSGLQYWNALRFPVPPPPRAAHDRGLMPSLPYGVDALRSVPRSTAPHDVARVLLEEMLTANGYYDYAEVVDATLAAASEQPTRQLPRSERAAPAPRPPEPE